MVDDHHPVLQLRGQVQREPGLGEAGGRRRNSDQHIVHDVLAKTTESQHDGTILVGDPSVILVPEGVIVN